MNKYNETAVIEFYKKGDKIYVEYNDLRLSLSNFFSLAKKDIDVAKAVLAIQKKMKALNYKKDIYSFIDTHFRYNSSYPDIIVRNGSSSSDSYADFDDKEIELGQKSLIKECFTLQYFDVEDMIDAIKNFSLDSIERLGFDNRNSMIEFFNEHDVKIMINPKDIFEVSGFVKVIIKDKNTYLIYSNNKEVLTLIR